MSKVTNILLFVCVIVLLFNLTGLYDTTDGVRAPSALLIGLLLHPENILAHNYYSLILAAITAAGTIGAIVGFFAGTRLSIIIKASIFGSMIIPIILELSSIYTVISANIHPVFAMLFISPILVVGIVAAVEWWQ